MNDGPVLFYCKDGVLYPVGMTEDELQMFTFILKTIEPLKVVFDQPQGNVQNLLAKKDHA